MALCVAVGLALFAGAANGFDKVSDLQEHFDKETHSGGKIRALDKLTDAQFEASRKASAEGNFVSVGFIFEKYRDNLRACFDLLRKQEPDAERHSGSYRQLELQTRRGLREVEDALVTAPPDMRPPLEIVRTDILDMDNELIRLLFPSRSQEPKKPDLPKEQP